jgi:hypothetical protein
MLRYLLDEQISPVVAEGVHRKEPKIQIASMHRWRDGEFLGRRDVDILRAAPAAHLTLVTYDSRTIPVILRNWAELAIPHAGVIFISERAIPNRRFGELVGALIRYWHVEGKTDWRNRITYLI